MKSAILLVVIVVAFICYGWIVNPPDVVYQMEKAEKVNNSNYDCSLEYSTPKEIRECFRIEGSAYIVCGSAMDRALEEGLLSRQPEPVDNQLCKNSIMASYYLFHEWPGPEGSPVSRAHAVVFEVVENISHSIMPGGENRFSFILLEEMQTEREANY